MNETEQRLYAIEDIRGHQEVEGIRQPDAIPLARRWLTHWTELLLRNPMSAVGPLASLITDVRISERKAMEAEVQAALEAFDE